MAGVILENVSRIYPGDVRAVDGIDLEVHDRELLVLVGPSGCGKTTTLRMIAGLEQPSHGKIRIGKRTVSDVPPRDRDVAMVFQSDALYPHLSVYRNMAFSLELRQRTGGIGRLWRWALPARRKAKWAARRAEIAQRVTHAARVLGIEQLLERFPRQLSGGERQRVALGRAIVRDPAVFLFDEPLSHLDAQLRVEMRRELKQLHQRLQVTMIYVTHDQVEALTLGDRIVVMNDGKLQQVGHPMELYDWPANRFVAGFLGTPAMNFLPGELVGLPGAARFRRGPWTVSLAHRPMASQVEGPAVLGVRPENVSIEKQHSPGPDAVSAVVRLVEMLGDATVATVELEAVEREAAEPGAVELGNRAAGDHRLGGRSPLPATGQHKDTALCVTTKMRPRNDFRVGDRVCLRVDPRHVHVFEPHGGKNWVRRTVGA